MYQAACNKNVLQSWTKSVLRILHFLFIYFYFILFATLITKNIGKEEEEEKKKEWRGDLTETIGAYERLGLLEL